MPRKRPSRHAACRPRRYHSALRGFIRNQTDSICPPSSPILRTLCLPRTIRRVFFCLARQVDARPPRDAAKSSGRTGEGMERGCAVDETAGKSSEESLHTISRVGSRLQRGSITARSWLRSRQAPREPRARPRTRRLRKKTLRRSPFSAPCYRSRRRK